MTYPFDDKRIDIPYTVKFEDGFYIAENTDLGIYVYEESIKDLRDSVIVQLRFLWNTYALADDSQLNKQAQVVKRNLLAQFGKGVKP